MTPRPMTITFANIKYLPVLLNWLLFLERQNIRNVHIFSLDQELHCLLAERGFATTLCGSTNSRPALWQLRVQVFADLIRNGIDFIHSDADAVWLRDPWPLIAAAQVDISSSQGTIWPLDVTRRRGFVTCCGFFHAKSNARTQAFFNDLVPHTTATGDDQISLNRLLESYETVWDLPADRQYFLSYDCTEFSCYATTAVGRSQKNGLSVGLLPHHAFQRLSVPTQPVYVKHPLDSDRGRPPQEHLRGEGCWLLRDDWEQVRFNASRLGELARPPETGQTCPPITGADGGAWTAQTHRALYPDIFNTGLAHFITDSLQPKTALEFGSGVGDLAAFIAANSGCRPIDCIEPLIMPEACFGNLSIRQFQTDIFAEPVPCDLLAKYDLVMSIEVAEHIHRDRHPALFDFLVAHCGHWMLFSGARIGQGGHGHIAERPEEEWRTELTSRGLIFCEELTLAARASCNTKNINHRRNVMVFRKSH